MKVVTRAVGMLSVLALAGVAQAQSSEGVRVWAGPSLSTRSSAVGQQLFASGGVMQDISFRGKDNLHFYGDVIRIVNRPIGTPLKTKEELIYGVGVATLFHAKGAAGTDLYYGFGLGMYRSSKKDSSIAGPSTSKDSVGGKVFVGTSIGGPYFLQVQGTVLSGRNDIQLGVGSRF